MLYHNSAIINSSRNDHSVDQHSLAAGDPVGARVLGIASRRELFVDKFRLARSGTVPGISAAARVKRVSRIACLYLTLCLSISERTYTASKCGYIDARRTSLSQCTRSVVGRCPARDDVVHQQELSALDFAFRLAAK